MYSMQRKNETIVLLIIFSPLVSKYSRKFWALDVRHELNIPIKLTSVVKVFLLNVLLVKLCFRGCQLWYLTLVTDYMYVV